MNRYRYRFLLGGYDLEMIEIRNILKQNREVFYDFKLQWGARLSSYIHVLNSEDTFVGIELTEDVPPPAHYIAIDHHNQNSHKPSSIEQIAELLGIKLNREQQLIAANDRGYIPAMIEMGATPDEITDIRCRDREAQGITEEDELLAEQSIRENLSTEKDLIIVNALTPRFSAITDRLFPFEKLLIYSDDSLTYYGLQAKAIAGLFMPLVEKHKAYYGGGENGFFGIARNSMSFEELHQIKEALISIITKQI
jgi:hypothetical protein